MWERAGHDVHSYPNLAVGGGGADVVLARLCIRAGACNTYFTCSLLEKKSLSWNLRQACQRFGVVISGGSLTVIRNHQPILASPARIGKKIAIVEFTPGLPTLRGRFTIGGSLTVIRGSSTHTYFICSYWKKTTILEFTPGLPTLRGGVTSGGFLTVIRDHQPVRTSPPSNGKIITVKFTQQLWSYVHPSFPILL